MGGLQYNDPNVIFQFLEVYARGSKTLILTYSVFWVARSGMIFAYCWFNLFFFFFFEKDCWFNLTVLVEFEIQGTYYPAKNK